MRFLGLVSVVVIAIFAAAFGVYHWLGGGSDSAVQVASPSSLPTVDSSSSAPSNNPLSSGNAVSSSSSELQSETVARQAPAGAEPPAEGTPVLDVTDTSSSADAPNLIDPGSAGDDVVDAPAADSTQADSTQAVVPKPRAPQVVARVIEKAEIEVAPKPAGNAPSFDVVRVEKTGEAILAGRAPVGSEVTIYDGDTPLGIVTADSRGQWVLVLDVPLVPGSHSLGVTARLPDETQIDSTELVIVAVPEPRGQRPTTDVAEGATPTELDAGGEVRTAQRPDADLTADLTPPTAVSDDATDSGDAPDSSVTPSQVALADTGVEEPIAVIVPRQGAGPARILQKPSTVGEGIGNGDLFLDSVDYDDDGRAVIGGRANAGAALIIYLDNIPIGEALTGDDGRWAMTPEDLVPVGLHRLRVDQVETDGKVLARVETPFSRADTITSHPDESFVTVQPGNSLWRIARTTYGQGTRYTVIYEINKEQIRDPDLIYPGQIFRLPSDG